MSNEGDDLLAVNVAVMISKSGIAGSGGAGRRGVPCRRYRCRAFLRYPRRGGGSARVLEPAVHGTAMDT
jgi:hypothetical protein